ncbi:hypothetical protein M758_UG343200 [Ceratodon purpureus]|nr:hypothetical protein M758_UG343200 [Ceratodon purpureus]
MHQQHDVGGLRLSVAEVSGSSVGAAMTCCSVEYVNGRCKSQRSEGNQLGLGCNCRGYYRHCTVECCKETLRYVSNESLSYCWLVYSSTGTILAACCS